MVFYLKCVIQHYEWGKHGFDSEVAKLAHNFNESLYSIEKDKPYAEGPSEILGHKQPDQPPVKILLSEYIESSPAKILGHKVVAKFLTKENGNLPFLFKVLSIAKPLSIQAHPNKVLAEILHNRDPFHYPDSNHKPETAIALTPFQALCGFRPPHEIMHNLKAFPDVETLIGTELCQTFYDKLAGLETSIDPNPNTSQIKESLKTCFTAFMNSPTDQVAKCVQAVITIISNKDIRRRSLTCDKMMFDIIVRCNQFFPGDIGCLSILFLNVINLKPGEAIFLGPDEPHAYLQGDCMECMACSDNVVRAGLTPKFKDVPVLCDMLTYDMGPASAKILEPCPIITNNTIIGSTNSSVTSNLFYEYKPPVDEFAVQRIELKLGDAGKELFKDIVLPTIQSASIIIIIKGEANYNLPPEYLKNGNGYATLAPMHQLRTGAVVFLNAGEYVSLRILVSPTTGQEAHEFDSTNDSSSHIEGNPNNSHVADEDTIFLAFRAYTPV